MRIHRKPGQLGLTTIHGSKLFVMAGAGDAGFTSVNVNGQELRVGSSAGLALGDSELAGSVTRDSSHELTVVAGHFRLVVESIDHFVNLRHVSVVPSSWSRLRSHGLLGHTWRNRRYAGRVKEIEGDIDDYAIEGDDLFGDSFVYNRFNN